MSPSVSWFYIPRVGSRFGVSYAATDSYWTGACTTESDLGHGWRARYVSLGKLVLYHKGLGVGFRWETKPFSLMPTGQVYIM